MRENPKANPGKQPCRETRMRENPKANSGRQPCRGNKDGRKAYDKSKVTTLQRKQEREKSLRQIQGGNPIEKTRQGEIPIKKRKTWSQPQMKGDDPWFSGGIESSLEIGRKP
jgi:hypothetical protein